MSRYTNPRTDNDLVISILLPAPPLEVYSCSKELADEKRYGVSFHDAIMSVLATLANDNYALSAEDTLTEIVLDTLEPDTESRHRGESANQWQHRQAEAKQFVSDILIAADLFLATYKQSISTLANLQTLVGFAKVGDAYRVDYTYTVRHHYDNNTSEMQITCPHEMGNDLDTPEEMPGYVLTQSSQSRHHKWIPDTAPVSPSSTVAAP